jgi:hypothetical protein
VDADEHEIDPHGHFNTDNVPCTICGKLPDERFIVGEEADHEYESGI